MSDNVTEHDIGEGLAFKRGHMIELFDNHGLEPGQAVLYFIDPTWWQRVFLAFVCVWFGFKAQVDNDNDVVLFNGMPS